MTWIIHRLKQKITLSRFRRLLAREKVTYSQLPKFVGHIPVIRNLGKIDLGENCRFRGLDSPIWLTTSTSQSELIIRDNCFFNHGVNICATESIHIGSDCRFGDRVTVYDSNFHCIDECQTTPHAAPVRIGRNVWIGAGAYVLAGVQIGNHSVVGAGSVVTQDVPEKVVVAGNPARIVRSIECRDNWVRN